MVAEQPSTTELKERGNAQFKKGAYEAAIELYTEAVDKLGSKTCLETAVILKNRAACYLKIENFEGVIEDINLCISMGGGDTKAYYRRAMAHQQLKQLDKALRDAMDSVRIDPKNKSAIDLVMALRRDIQGRKDLMTSTTGLVDEMLGSLRDQEADVDKKTQALKNLVNLTSNKTGSETLIKRDGLKDVVRFLTPSAASSTASTTASSTASSTCPLQTHALNCVICVTRDSLARTKLVLSNVPLSVSVAILRENNDNSKLVGGVLFEMLNSVLEDRGYDYTKRELGEAFKKFPIPRLLSTLFDYFKECCNVAKGEALDSLINALVKCTDSRVLNEELQEKNMINFLINLVVSDQLTYQHAQQISIVVSKTWARSRIDGAKSLKFVKQVTSIIDPRLLSGEENHQMLALRALNILLQGSFEAGSDVIKDNSEIYRILSKLLISKNLESQRTAAESVALFANDKKMCYNLASQNFNLLKALYKSEEVDDSVKLRALVGMSKMVASSGGDVNRNIIADGAGLRIFKQIRQLLLKSPTSETGKWVIEALAYLTIDAEVKHELAKDEEQMKIICNFSSDPAPSTSYSLSCIFMNLTNSYEKPDVAPEMAKIAEYAKQDVPKDHELDSEDNLNIRIGLIVKHGVPSVLATCASADSERTREFVARSFLALVSSEEGKHCGEVVQLGGTRALLNLFQENTKAGKVSSAHAIAKIAIKMNPALAFSGQRALDACRPCISLIESVNENTFLVYDGLMALTNLASVSDSVRERIIREGGCYHIDFQQLEDNEALRRAATQTVCNLSLSEKFRERYRPEDAESTEPVDRLKAIIVFCGDEDYYTRVAALGAVAYLSADSKICKCIINIGSFEEIVKETICIEDPGIRHRLLVTVQNMMASDKDVAEFIINTPIFECLLALMQVAAPVPAMKEVLNNCMEAAKHWGLIEQNPGDYVYSRQ